MTNLDKHIQNAKTVELKMLSFKVGWFNIEDEQNNNWFDVVSSSEALRLGTVPSRGGVSSEMLSTISKMFMTPEGYFDYTTIFDVGEDYDLEEAVKRLKKVRPAYENPYLIGTNKHNEYEQTLRRFVHLRLGGYNSDADSPTKVYLDDGYYNFCELAEHLNKKRDIKVELNDVNLRVTLFMKPNTVYVFSGGLARMLGFDSPNSTRNHIIYVNPSDEFVTKIGSTSLNLSKNNTLHILANIASTSNNLLTIGGNYPVLGSIISTKGFCDLEVFTTGFDPRCMVHGSHHSLKFDLINNAGEPVGCSNITLILETKCFV